ncbi:alpha-L-arabinofuranosidase II precursor [Streptomyces sp. NL15-2K]|nr:alpha-L-arabinofuranosidase II precursor [Streptomyces sp. NL15-2K]
MVLALLSTVLAVVLPAQTAAAVNYPLASTPLITWNMQGANEAGPDTNKWQNHVRSYARQAPVVMLQEAGATPARTSNRQTDLTRTTVGRDGHIRTRTIQHYHWNLDTSDHPTLRNVFFALTQNEEGGRVNLAIVVEGDPDEVNVVQNPVEAGRIALGVRFGANWYFTVHGLSGGGGDSAVLLNTIDEQVDHWATDRQVQYNWTVGGDFNVDPNALARRDAFPIGARTIHTPANVATHNSRNRLDYFVTDVLHTDPRDAYVVGTPPSDHRVVGAGRLRGSAERPPSKINLMPIGDDLTQGIGSSDESGARDEIQVEIGKMTWGGLFGSLDSSLVRPGLDSRDLVGSRSHGRGIPDTHHEGWPGHTIDRINQRVQFPPSRPNVVTLLAGTNDMVNNDNAATAPDRLNKLIDRIFAEAPDVAIVVGTLPPSTDPAVQPRIDAYNNAVRQLVDDRTARGDHLVLVELTAVTTEDLVDSVHPGDAGYHKIAEAFVAGIRMAVVDGWVKEPSGSPNPPAPQDPLPDPTVGRTDIRGADPSVIRVGGTYHSVQSGDGRLWVRPASSPAGLDDAEPVPIWRDPGLGEVWAPELVRIDGRYYVYFSAGRGPDHRMYVISSASPASGYGAERKLALPEDRWAIDGTPFTFENQLWFVW